MARSSPDYLVEAKATGLELGRVRQKEQDDSVGLEAHHHPATPALAGGERCNHQVSVQRWLRRGAANNLPLPRKLFSQKG
jgi:hypothetical protein